MDRTTQPPEAGGYFITAIARAMSVLEAYGESRPELTYSELAELTGLSRATIRRIVLTLRDLGFVQSQDGRTYRLTPRALQLGYSYLASLPMRDVARPHLEALSENLSETASLAILDGPEIVYVAIAMSPRLTSVRINLGTRLPARTTAAGHVLLSDLSADQVTQALQRTEQPLPQEAAACLQDALRDTERRGWAILDHELDDNLHGAAAPVRDAQGTVSAAVCVSVHRGSRTHDTMKDRIIPAVRQTAIDIQTELGTPAPV